jgi:hypothetical protein
MSLTNSRSRGLSYLWNVKFATRPPYAKPELKHHTFIYISFSAALASHVISPQRTRYRTSCIIEAIPNL